jgi:hypothetical protein
MLAGATLSAFPNSALEVVTDPNRPGPGTVEPVPLGIPPPRSFRRRLPASLRLPAQLDPAWSLGSSQRFTAPVTSR